MFYRPVSRKIAIFNAFLLIRWLHLLHLYHPPPFWGSRILEGMQRLYWKLHSFSQLVLQYACCLNWTLGRPWISRYSTSWWDRPSYVMMRQTFIRHDENFPGRSPTQWLFMCTASDAATVEIFNATGRNVGMAEAVNLFSQEGYSVTYYTIMKLSSLLNFILKPHCQEAIMWNFSDK